MDVVIKLSLLKESIYRGSCFMIHAVWGLRKCGCLIQSLVHLWEWKCYKPASSLLMISWFPRLLASFQHQMQLPPTLSTGTFSTFRTPLSQFTPAADSCGCVSHLAFVLDEWTHRPLFGELLIFFFFHNTSESHNRCKDSSFFSVWQIKLCR